MITAYHRPASVDELVGLRSRWGTYATVVAGATDLGVRIRRGVSAPTRLLDLTGVEELRRLEQAAGHLVIGAAVTHRRVERSALFAGPLAALREACATIGSVQTRNVGTVGGNLCNASPAADTPPALLTFDAKVELAGPAGRRRLPLDEFFVGYRATAMSADEVLVAVHVPVPDERTGSAFEKLGRRRAMEISIVCVAARISLTGSGTVATARVALGSVAATSIRATEVERQLVGCDPDTATIEAAAAAVTKHVRPVDDIRASAGYRHRVAPVLVSRAVRRAVARAQQREAK